MLNIEGLGRQLDPDLDLWKTAKPYLERWMNEQVGWRGMMERMRAEAPRFAQIFPQLPRLAYQALQQTTNMEVADSALLMELLHHQRRTNRVIVFVSSLLGILFSAVAVTYLWGRWHGLP
jgi:ubiquinone biosynthesis protein